MQGAESHNVIAHRWMRGIQFRYLVLIGVLAIGIWLFSASGDQTREPRWPKEDKLFAADGWSVSQATVDVPFYASPPFISRRYQRSGAKPAVLTFVSSPDAKKVYRAGGEVPFLGNGYAVEPAPTSLVPPASGRTAIVVRRESELGLVLYAYGEHRGVLGNGPLAWGLVGLDAIIGRPNDYVKMAITAPIDSLDSSQVSPVVSLADAIFPRLAAWYGSQS